MAASELDSRYSQAAADYLCTDDFPVELICPITQTLMHDPVLTVQGNVYERAAITEWLQSHATDPVTNAPLTALTLIPCNPIKAEVEAFKAALTKLSPAAAAKLPSATLSEKKSQSITEPTQIPGSHLQTSTSAAAVSQPEPTAPVNSAPQSHAPASPVSFPRLSQPLTSCREALKAALHCEAQVSSFQSVIGMYLESKQISAEVFANSVLVPGFKGIKGRLTSGYLQSALEYGRSFPSIRKFNHLMHKLEQLSGQVLDSRPEVKLLWTAALSPFRRQLFNDMYTHHSYVQAFAGGLPGGRFGLPTMDNWSLGIWQGPDYDPDNMFGFEPRPLQLDQSRSVLSQVHTVLLIDDNASMAQTGSAQYGPGTSRWQQASAIIRELAPIIAQHDPQGIDLYFLKHRFPGRGNVQQGLQSSQEVQAVLSRVRPAGHALLEARVRAILDAYMSTLRYERYLKPLNLVVITDGTALEGGLPPFLSDTINRHVDRVVKRGHPAHQLGIEFLQVGNSQEATRHLLQLEQQVSDHHRNINWDVVGITPVGRLGHTMNGELLAQLIGSGIDARVSQFFRQQRLNI